MQVLTVAQTMLIKLIIYHLYLDYSGQGIELRGLSYQQIS